MTIRGHWSFIAFMTVCTGLLTAMRDCCSPNHVNQHSQVIMQVQIRQDESVQKKDGILPLVAVRSGRLSRAALHSAGEASTPSGFLVILPGT